MQAEETNMGWYKPTRNPADKEFSDYIRQRDGWKCVYGFKCFKAIDYSMDKGGLDCSHCFKRGKWSTRYDPQNCDSACKKCHNFIENEKDGQKILEDWKRKQLGEDGFKKLMIRAHTSDRTMRDLPLVRLYIKQLKKELKH